VGGEGKNFNTKFGCENVACTPFSSGSNHWRCSYTGFTHHIWMAIDTYMRNTGYHHLFKAKLLVEIVGMDENQMMTSLKHGVHIGIMDNGNHGRWIEKTTTCKIFADQKIDKMHNPSFSKFWTIVSTMAKEARLKSTKQLSGSEYNPYK
jgi:hypothetical protein